MLKAMFAFHGRIGRMTYFVSNLIMVLPAILVVVLTAAVEEASKQAQAGHLNDGTSALVLMSAVLLIALCGLILWVGLATTVKRLHDMGVTGLWAIGVLLISIIGLVLALIPGSEGRNKYGEVPGDKIFDVGSETPQFAAHTASVS